MVVLVPALDHGPERAHAVEGLLRLLQRLVARLRDPEELLLLLVEQVRLDQVLELRAHGLELLEHGLGHVEVRDVDEEARVQIRRDVRDLLRELAWAGRERFNVAST